VGARESRIGVPAVSVILPIHDERDNLAPLMEELRAALAGRTFEVIAVDDQSADGSLQELRRLAEGAPELRVLRLARRGGQSGALAAGWRAARGPIVVTLDADRQYDPADIPALLDALARDAALTAALGVRRHRQDGWWKRLQSRVASWVREALTGHRVHDTACGLKALRRSALLALPAFDGMHRFLPTLLVREGGRVAEFPVSHRSRRYGRSKYGMWNRALRGVRDALGVRWLLRRRLAADAEEVT
jgi:glycosyltransferase involved in cell wall biosynthesis